MKRILLTIICILPVFGFCDWKEYYKPIDFGSENDIGYSCKLKISKEFKSDVALNYILHVARPLFFGDINGGEYLIEFLDSDGFLIEKVSLGKFISRYTGSDRGIIQVSKNTLNQSERMRVTAREI